MISVHVGPPEFYPALGNLPAAAAYGVGLAIVAGDVYVSTGTAWAKLADNDDGASAINDLLTGFTSGAGTVAATDSILAAVQKLDGNIALKATDLLTGYTSGAGTVAATDTVLEAIQKLDGNIALKADPVAAADGDFYVASSSGGAVTTKLTFTNGILTAITP